VEERALNFSKNETLTPGRMIDVWWDASSLWWFLFPVVTAYAVFMFSYEFDKGILKAYLLSCVEKRTLFLAKLLSIMFGLLTSLGASMLIVYALADPYLFALNPLDVYINIPRRFIMYTLMLYSMVGIATLSSIAFRKPLCAFVVPIAIIYTLNMIGLHGISTYVPPQCYPDIRLLGSIGLVPMEYFLSKLSLALPTIIASTTAIITAYIFFVKRDIT
jgi:ABC-type transport system involved in multi-copper enzyme maturation permease subunit